MKKILITAFLLGMLVKLLGQSKYSDTDREAIKQFMNNRDSMPVLSQNKSEEEIKRVLKQYNIAVGKLDVTGTEKLFTKDSKIYESGGSEGNYAQYLEHHLKPELKEFKSFTYTDYKVEIQVAGNYAFTTETYNYIILVATDSTEVKRQGVATSVLNKLKGEWRIMINHNSSRK